MAQTSIMIGLLIDYSFGRSCDVSQLLGRSLTVGWVATSQACFNYQQLASLTNDAHACLHVDQWPQMLIILLKFFPGSLVVKWSLHCIGSVTLPPTMQWLHRNPSPLLPRTREQWTAVNRLAHLPVSSRRVCVNTTSARQRCRPYRPVVNAVRCPVRILLKSASTACKRLQVFLSIHKL